MKKPVRDFRVGQETIGGTAAEALPSLGIEVQRCIRIKADASNAGQIYVGREGVTTGTGYELSAKEEIELEVDTSMPIWVVASQASQKYSWIAH